MAGVGGRRGGGGAGHDEEVTDLDGVLRSGDLVRTPWRYSPIRSFGTNCSPARGAAGGTWVHTSRTQ